MATDVRVQVTRAETKFTVGLAVMDCASCGVIYAIPDEFDDRRRKDGHNFYCPNGHSQSYGKSEADRLREQLAAANRDKEWFRTGEAEQRQRREQAERSAAAYKGQATKLRKRAIAGVCAFCHRHFANVERHVAGQHRNITADPADA